MSQIPVDPPARLAGMEIAVRCFMLAADAALDDEGFLQIQGAPASIVTLESMPDNEAYLRVVVVLEIGGFVGDLAWNLVLVSPGGKALRRSESIDRVGEPHPSGLRRVLKTVREVPLAQVTQSGVHRLVLTVEGGFAAQMPVLIVASGRTHSDPPPGS